MNLIGKKWKKRGHVTMHFDGVWERQPVMLETAQTYLRWLLLGRFGKRRGWKTVRDYKSFLSIFAEMLEKKGKVGFSEFSPKVLWDWWRSVEKTEGNRAAVELLMRMFACRGLPHLPMNPLHGELAENFIVQDKVTQTEPIEDGWWVLMMKRALSYEDDAHRLAAWLETRDWDAAWLREKGVCGKRSLTQYIWEVRMAGVILLLGFTGMRKSELCALRKHSLECVQRGRPFWVVWGTVFKFFGEGERARWVCGEIGRRGYAMLSAIAENDDELVPKGLKITMNEKLNGWLERQNFEKDPNFPQLHAHQFRRTLARFLIVEDEITLVAIKEQYKHKTTVMTAYYCGSDAHLLAKCTARDPILGMCLTDLIKEAENDE